MRSSWAQDRGQRAAAIGTTVWEAERTVIGAGSGRGAVAATSSMQRRRLVIPGERGLHSACRRVDAPPAASLPGRASPLAADGIDANAVPTAYITHPSFLLHDMGPYHPECPDRLTAIGDRLIAAGLDGLSRRTTRRPRRRASSSLRVHGAAYIDEIEAREPGVGPALPRSRHRAQPAFADRRAARGRRGRAGDRPRDARRMPRPRSARCARPATTPSAGRAMGFCLFNNVAVGAAHALAAHGLERVAIVDFDVHHGNGTEDIFSDDPRVLMVVDVPVSAVSVFGRRQSGRRTWSTSRCRAGTGSEEFRAAVRERWLPALDAHRPQMIFVSAGFDAHREDPLAGLELRRRRLRVGDARARARSRSAMRRAASCPRSKAATRCPRSAAARPSTSASSSTAERALCSAMERRRLPRARCAR